MNSDFPTVRLGDSALKIGSGATPRGGKEAYKDYGISLIRSQNIYNNRFSRNGLAFIDKEQAALLDNVEVLPRDVLLNITGDSVARACQVPKSVLPARVNQHVAIIRPNPRLLLPKFVKYYLVSPFMQAYMLSIAGAGATRKALTKGMIEDFEIPAPNIDEQTAIVGILGTLDDKIELNRQMNQTLEAMARAIFKSWFVDFDPVHVKLAARSGDRRSLVDGSPGRPYPLDAETLALFPDRFVESELGPIPEGWEVRTIPEVFFVNPKRTLKKGQIAPYLGMRNMPTSAARPQSWIYREYGSGMRFVNGDTLVARITPCLENGKTAFVDFLESEEIGWGSTEYIVLRSKPLLPLEFAYYLARTNEFRSYAIANMTGTSGRQRVSANSFDHYQIVVPSQEVAQRFGDIAKNFMAMMKQNDDESRTLAELRDTLLPKLISGELRVGEMEGLVR